MTVAEDWTTEVVESLAAQGISAGATLDDTHLSDGRRVTFGPARMVGRIYYERGVYTVTWHDGVRSRTSISNVVEGVAYTVRDALAGVADD